MRDYAAELATARAAEDWEAHARIWEERRVAEIDREEAELEAIKTVRAHSAVLVDQKRGQA